ILGPPGGLVAATFCHTGPLGLLPVFGGGATVRVDPSQINDALALPARWKLRRIANAPMRDWVSARSQRATEYSSIVRGTHRLFGRSGTAHFHLRLEDVAKRGRGGRYANHYDASSSYRRRHHDHV